MANCDQVNLPEIDNTLVKCKDFYHSDCVIVEKNCSKIEFEEGSLSEFIEKLCFKLAKMDNEIMYLKKQINSNV